MATARFFRLCTTDPVSLCWRDVAKGSTAAEAAALATTDGTYRVDQINTDGSVFRGVPFVVTGKGTGKPAKAGRRGGLADRPMQGRPH